MDLTPYVDSLRQQLAIAAEAGGEDARELAERLTAPLEAAARLTLLNALSAAASEITRDLAPGSVDLRLRGLDPDFVVTPPLTHQPFIHESLKGAREDHAEPAPTAVHSSAPQAPPEAEEGGTARINLRLPAHLKVRVEEAASREGLSVNSWLVRAASASLESGANEHRGGRSHRWGSQSYTGWVR
ncbi:hypothetical protein [Kitasatospora sp. HPMI-4]|uniref:hypothetical protein n=1 Tax=Kitasatospora sp. HPMI-4 TaxID=3448443 RepID=UPI003F1948E4